jgi:hypothetical protein
LRGQELAEESHRIEVALNRPRRFVRGEQVPTERRGEQRQITGEGRGLGALEFLSS